MVWVAISWNFLGPIVAQHIDQQQGLHEHLGDFVHSMVQALFPDGDGIFQDDNAPIHAAYVVNNWYEEHGCELEHIEWPSEDPDLNSTEHLWCVLERQDRNRYPSPSYLKKLE